MKKKKNHTTLILVLILLMGLSLLLYPSISDYWNSFHQSRSIIEYTQNVSTLDTEEYKKLWNLASDYNSKLIEKNNEYVLSSDEKKEYESLLNVSDNGVMGYVEIPKIKCNLPIYHGTDESALQVAIGHLEWTSLPVGGESTHCVLSGHRGLPSAKLFTNLDELEIGDTFMLHVLDETLTYEVDQILIVEPQQTKNLKIVEGEDLCTLVTCTPYGINTHRLLVRGHRIENQDKSVFVNADALQIEPMVVALGLAIPILVILLLFVFLKGDD
ncbi:MAG: class C sortase [Erysipelotrichaceae bacterium]|uniref:class C sortase n=1 Tax=Floccifex sp. TaxID=2815810 RepID=UPI002A7596E1|nr:class C sortase [Floccifex sp.]MDD7282021.1 class C sortase [Erysipelotrichaceae bacterium]MDY2958701.1 class C sortase [Floccifex sp.]